MRNNKIENRYGYSRRQRICAWLALIGIFVCGMMAGAFIWQTKSTHTADSGTPSVIEHFVERDNIPCYVKEQALQEKLTGNDHQYNARIYDTLEKIGCEKNKEKFANFAKSERELFDALYYVENGKHVVDFDNVAPCKIIETTLKERIHDCYTPRCYLDNAEIYSKLAEDGCPENAEEYKNKALKELDIADGVRVDETDIGTNEIRSTVNTYRKLQMQNEAKKYLNKVEKLVNPGIDFIMELQRVIEE